MAKNESKREIYKQVILSDVIVIDQREYAVALIYDPKIHDAPILTTKGTDKIAKLILRIAKKRKIWITVDNKYSRLLYEDIIINSPISEKYYKPVSYILANVEKTIH